MSPSIKIAEAAPSGCWGNKIFTSRHSVRPKGHSVTAPAAAIAAEYSHFPVYWVAGKRILLDQMDMALRDLGSSVVEILEVALEVEAVGHSLAVGIGLADRQDGLPGGDSSSIWVVMVRGRLEFGRGMP